MTATYRDWTIGPDGRTNTSPEFLAIVNAVERLIRDDAHQLIAGRADRTAGLIVAQLAHKHGLAPVGPCPHEKPIDLTIYTDPEKQLLCADCGHRWKEPR